MQSLEVIVKHLIELRKERKTAQQGDACSSASIGLTGYELIKSEIQQQRLSDQPGTHARIALDDVAEQVRKFFLK